MSDPREGLRLLWASLLWLAILAPLLAFAWMSAGGGWGRFPGFLTFALLFWATPLAAGFRHLHGEVDALKEEMQAYQCDEDGPYQVGYRHGSQAALQAINRRTQEWLAEPSKEAS